MAISQDIKTSSSPLHKAGFGTVVLDGEQAALLQLGMAGGPYSDASRIYQRLKDAYLKNAQIYDSVAGNSFGSTAEFRRISEAALIDGDQTLAILRCIKKLSAREISTRLNIPEKTIPVSIFRALNKIGTQFPMTIDERKAAIRIVPELFEVGKALIWKEDLDSWFKNPGFRPPRCGNINLSGAVAADVVPWLNGMTWTLDKLIRDAGEKYPLKGGRENLPLNLSVQVDKIGCVVLQVALRAEQISLPADKKQLVLAKFLIGGAIKSSATLEELKTEDIFRARALSDREQATTVLLQKLPSLSTKNLRQDMLFLLAGGTINLHALSKVRPVHLIKNRRKLPEKREVTTFALTVIDAVRVKPDQNAPAKLAKSVLVLPKSKKLQETANLSARIFVGQKAIRHFVCKGTFIGAPLQLRVSSDTDETRLNGTVQVVSWLKEHPPVFRFAQSNIIQKSAERESRWFRWGADWLKGIAQSAPQTILLGEFVKINNACGIYALGKRLLFKDQAAGQPYCLLPVHIARNETTETHGRFILVINAKNSVLIAALKLRNSPKKPSFEKCASGEFNDICGWAGNNLSKLLEQKLPYSRLENS